MLGARRSGGGIISVGWDEVSLSWSARAATVDLGRGGDGGGGGIVVHGLTTSTGGMLGSLRNVSHSTSYAVVAGWASS